MMLKMPRLPAKRVSGALFIPPKKCVIKNYNISIANTLIIWYYKFRVSKTEQVQQNIFCRMRKEWIPLNTGERPQS